VFIKDSLVEMDMEGVRGGEWCPLLKEAVEEGLVGVPREGQDPSLGLWAEPDGSPLPPLLAIAAFRAAAAIIEHPSSSEYLAVRIQQELTRSITH
jgi:hypothetical protein